MPLWGKKPPRKGGNGHDPGRSSSPKGHRHDWHEIRRSNITKGPFKGKQMVFYKCYAKGCAQPDKIEIEG